MIKSFIARITNLRFRYETRFEAKEMCRRAKQIIDREDVKIVSFDIFDTLIVRPSLSDDDLWQCLSKRIEEKYGIDYFYSARHDAEWACGVSNPSLVDIWNYIGKKYVLSEKHIRGVL